MTDLSDEEYADLADDIREVGVLQPVIVDDSDDQVIIDGHHREAIAQAYDLPKEKQPAYVVVSGLDDDGKLPRAIKQNVIGRDTTDAVKSRAVKQYIELSWQRTDDGDLIRPETDQEVADKLGVSRRLVSQVINSGTDAIIYHDHVAARDYYENNPDASYREVAEQVETSQPTVTEWLKEDFNEGQEDTDDDQQTFSITAGDKAEAKTVSEISQKATTTEGGTVSKTARNEAERLAKSKTTPEEASKTVDKAEEVAQDEQQREQNRGSFARAVENDNAVEIVCDDFRNVLNNRQSESVDHIITDPPYDEGSIDEWNALAGTAADVLKPGGFVAAYSGQYFLPEVFDALSGRLEYFWQFIVTHEQPNYFIKHDIGIKYKPVVVFGKPPLERPGRQAHDVIGGGGRDKDDHDWQQPVVEAAELVIALSEPDDLICDPMCGSGTTGVAALTEQRRTLLIDNDRSAIDTATKRIAGVVSDE
jgi:site-specific DNA-methyltransferase (adenine-specific)